LPNLSQDFGLDLWIKRDDLTGFAFGGNKGRKLEYIMADVLASGATAVVTCGSAQSNFVRQVAGACARLGLRFAAAVMVLPYPDGDPRPPGPTETKGGNLLLNSLFGAEIHLFPDGGWSELDHASSEVVRKLEAQGERVYQIPLGGSSPLGAYAFYLAGKEVAEQAAPFDFVVTASSSGSTHTGLAAFFRGSGTKVIGISCDPEPDITEDLSHLSEGLAKITGDSKMEPNEFWFDLDSVGPGYGFASDSGTQALSIMALREAILLDPVYSAKAFDGLIRLAKNGTLGGRVLFWHTGGTPTLFAESRSVP
jgi:1-aminocyclopropane-1-carboxylate deaminase/D-cysteine desulfhydrase-like pyridoxal-dependent ACC family enzyme